MKKQVLKLKERSIPTMRTFSVHRVKKTRTEEKDDLSTLLPPQKKVWSDVVSGKNVDVANKESRNAIVGNSDNVQDSKFTEKWTKVFSKRQETLRN
jgi:hypothetical protein